MFVLRQFGDILMVLDMVGSQNMEKIYQKVYSNNSIYIVLEW